MLLSFLFIPTSSWGPIFHQVVAQEFANEYLFHLTKEQTNAFVVGSVFVDGLSRKKYHDLSNLVPLLHEYDSNSSLEYWFVLGFILHMAADSSGHIGFPLSYLPLRRYSHYLSELIVCSAVFHDRKPPSISSDAISNSVYQKTAKVNSIFFGFFYKIWRIIVRFPFYFALPLIQSDGCSLKNDKKYAMCNLDLHIDAIKRLMYDALVLLNQGKLTNENLGKLTLNELSSFKCCL